MDAALGRRIGAANAEREAGAVPEQVGDGYRARVLDTISLRRAPIGWGHGAA